MQRELRNMTEPELRDLMNALGRQITAVCAVLEVENPLFMLLLFNDPQVAQYVSNCQRSDAIRALREAADRLERNDTVER